jgi:hypothetical protein
MRPSCASAALGDVEVGEHLEPRDHRRDVVARQRGRHLAQQAVDPEADVDVVVVALDVDVARPQLDGAAEDLVDQLRRAGPSGGTRSADRRELDRRALRRRVAEPPAAVERAADLEGVEPHRPHLAARAGRPPRGPPTAAAARACRARHRLLALSRLDHAEDHHLSLAAQLLVEEPHGARVDR